ncbi:hypothetical protein [Aliiglaciecola aliphaticivorans]
MNIQRHLLLGFSILVLLLSACVQKQESPIPAAAKVKITDSDKQQATKALRTLADDVWADYLAQDTYYRLQEGLPIERFEDLTLQE